MAALLGELAEAVSSELSWGGVIGSQLFAWKVTPPQLEKAATLDLRCGRLKSGWGADLA